LTTNTAEVAIIGAGVEGLSVAWALTRDGVTDVIIVDRGAVGSGFTGKSSGIVRCHYGVPSIAAMAWRSLPVLEDAPTVLGAEIGFRRCGYLVIVGHDNVVPLEVNVAMQRALGIDAELIRPQEVSARFPAMRVDDVAAAAYESRGGFADAYSTAQAFAQAARRAGARVRQGTEVTSIATRNPEGFTLVLANGDHLDAATLVVAAGPWTPALIAPLGLDLPMRAQREQLMIVDPGGSTGALPVVSDLVTLQYVRPEGRDHLLVGNSDHYGPEWVDPDAYVDAMDDDALTDAIPKFEHRFPGFESVGLAATYAGCYDVTPDYNPVISATPIAGLYICAGFSGHGFKIAPAVGQLTADLIVHGTSTVSDIDAADFRLARFEEGRLLSSPHPYAGAPEMR
jgi:sarcosine oxidase subunit beta